MANAAEKVTQLPRPAPDGTKPVALEYFYTPGVIGATVDHHVQVGTNFKDGNKVSGLVQSITLYPSGFVIAEIRCGWQPGVLDAEQQYRTEYYALGPGGHGRVVQEGSSK